MPEFLCLRSLYKICLVCIEYVWQFLQRRKVDEFSNNIKQTGMNQKHRQFDRRQKITKLTNTSLSKLYKELCNRVNLFVVI
jgi:hypothetical protein